MGSDRWGYTGPRWPHCWERPVTQPPLAEVNVHGQLPLAKDRIKLHSANWNNLSLSRRKDARLIHCMFYQLQSILIYNDIYIYTHHNLYTYIKIYFIYYTSIPYLCEFAMFLSPPYLFVLSNPYLSNTIIISVRLFQVWSWCEDPGKSISKIWWKHSLKLT